MKYFIALVIWVSFFLLYAFRPWGQEKEALTLMAAFGMYIALGYIVYKGWKEDWKEERKKNKTGF